MGFIEAEGSFYVVEERVLDGGEKGSRIEKAVDLLEAGQIGPTEMVRLRPEFNLSQKNELELLHHIGREMGLSGKNRVSEKASGHCVLTAVSVADIQAVVNFMSAPERVRLRGLKRVKYLK